MTLDKLVDALKQTGIPFAAWAWDGTPDGPAWGVCAVDSSPSRLGGEGMTFARSVQGTVDLFAAMPARCENVAVECVLRGCEGIRWYLNTVQQERDTGLMHWEWVVTWLEEVPAGEDAGDRI